MQQNVHGDVQMQENLIVLGYKAYNVLYSRKLWWALNLANQSSVIWQSRVLPHRAIMYENWIMLVGFKFGDFPQNCQLAKLKTLPKFPAIQYCTLFSLAHPHYLVAAAEVLLEDLQRKSCRQRKRRSLCHQKSHQNLSNSRDELNIYDLNAANLPSDWPNALIPPSKNCPAIIFPYYALS